MESIPDDIQKKILIRLPLKSLLACIFVCKKWKNMIYDEKFKDDYLLRSMTRVIDSAPDSLFHSTCREPYQYVVSTPIRGWICVQSSNELRLIYNPITNERLHLPVLVGRGQPFPYRCLFGYDEANAVFKVLGSVNSSFVVYTVRSGGEESWRPIACEHPHTYVDSVTNALCKGGVLYYVAILSDFTTTIMSFDLSSEEFNVIPLPEGVILRYDATMVTYNGKVALVNNKSETGEFQICVRNEDSGQWELQQIVIPGWRDNVGNDRFFSFVGTIGTGDLVFTASLPDGSESVLHYNTNQPQGSSGFIMSRIEADNGGSYHYVRTCLNHFYPLLRANQEGTMF